jgi:hypothetical protein
MGKIISAVLLALAFVGCGSSDRGSPGSWGSEDTNILVGAEVTPDSDIVDLCASGDAGALANITAQTINEELPENTLYLEGYTVEYTPGALSSPPIEPASYTKGGLTLPVSSLSLVLLEEERKRSYQDDLSDGYGDAGDYSEYEAKYTFYGEDIYGSDFGAVAYTSFEVGNRSECVLSISPEAVSLTGLANPDGDASDDITFHISGGSGPYTVYSDNVGVIEGPGTLQDGGALSFTVDPDAVAAETTITLSVLDSLGDSATAIVTVTP